MQWRQQIDQGFMSSRQSTSRIMWGVQNIVQEAVGEAIPKRKKTNNQTKLSSVKQITSTGWMHETSARTWCTGKTYRERVEREVGGGIGMRNTCKPMAVSFQCMTKSTTNKKKKSPSPRGLLCPYHLGLTIMLFSNTKLLSFHCLS